MHPLLTTGTLLQCTMGVAPCVFKAQPLPGAPKSMGALPMAAISEIMPANIVTFGMCQSLANPSVASATAAAMGTLTPMPCKPNIVSPWAPPAVSNTIAMVPLATIMSKCMCAFGGTISASTAPPGPNKTM